VAADTFVHVADDADLPDDGAILVSAARFLEAVPDAARLLEERVAAELGRLDGLVNNAGIVRDGLLVKVKDGAVVGEMSLDQWNAVIGVNLTGVFLCGREAAKRMIELGNGGVIVNISSISRVGNAGQSNYSAAKAGVESMAVVWAKELARYGIRAAAVAPGFTRTDILSAMRPEVLNKLTAPVPLKRLGLAEEIAHYLPTHAEASSVSTTGGTVAAGAIGGILGGLLGGNDRS